MRNLSWQAVTLIVAFIACASYFASSALSAKAKYQFHKLNYRRGSVSIDYLYRLDPESGANELIVSSMPSSASSEASQ